MSKLTGNSTVTITIDKSIRATTTNLEVFIDDPNSSMHLLSHTILKLAPKIAFESDKGLELVQDGRNNFVLRIVE